VLLIGGREVTADARPATTNQLTFRITDAAPQADSRIVLTVDDVASVPFQRIAAPPGLAFNPAHLVTIV
jgi:hypothetical protein